MAYVYVRDVPSSWEQYELVEGVLVDPPPTGLLVHVAGPTDAGVRVIDVWESEEAWERFRAERLTPAIAALGGPYRPEPTFRELHPERVVVRSETASSSRGPEKEER